MTPTHAIDTSLRNQILDHMAGAIAAAKTQDDPFPHFVLQGFFPEPVYAQLLECLPPLAQYKPFTYEGSNKDGQSSRYCFRLKNQEIDGLSPLLRTFWYTVRSTLGSEELKEFVFEKLRAGMAYRFGCKPAQVKALPGFANPELYHESAGYRIAPHPDTRKKVVTMQVSLARDGRNEHLGTEFYRRSFNPAHLFREPKGFEIVKTMPFLPNTVYAFVVLNTIRLKSWHGRSLLEANSHERNSILNIWYGKAEQANPEIQEDLRQLVPQKRAA